MESDHCFLLSVHFDTYISLILLKSKQPLCFHSVITALLISYLDIMPKDKVPNSNDKSTIVQSEANLVSSVLRHHRPNSTSSIETPILKHTSGKKPRLLKVDSNTIETTSLSLFRAGEKRKSVPPEDSTKKFKKVTKDNYYFIQYLLIYYNFYSAFPVENHLFLDRSTYSMSRETVTFHFHSL